MFFTSQMFPRTYARRAGVAMIGFGVITGVGEVTTEGETLACLVQKGREAVHVDAGSRPAKTATMKWLAQSGIKSILQIGPADV